MGILSFVAPADGELGVREAGGLSSLVASRSERGKI
jgi:hypothetical protein